MTMPNASIFDRIEKELPESTLYWLLIALFAAMLWTVYITYYNSRIFGLILTMILNKFVHFGHMHFGKYKILTYETVLYFTFLLFCFLFLTSSSQWRKKRTFHPFFVIFFFFLNILFFLSLNLSWKIKKISKWNIVNFSIRYQDFMAWG